MNHIENEFYLQCMFLRFHQDFLDNHLHDHHKSIEEQYTVHFVDIERVPMDQYILNI